jgi:putative tryptophan/tyrosine transport system substrate-binding protein
MRRRKFIADLGGAVAWPLVAGAQQSQVAIVGFLSAGAPEAYSELMHPFHRGLQAVGYIEGQNLTVEARYTEGDFSLIPQLATDLIRRGAVVIVTTGTSSTLGAARVYRGTRRRGGVGAGNTPGRSVCPQAVHLHRCQTQPALGR